VVEPTSRRVPDRVREPLAEVPFRDAVRFWVRLGFINFGGPTGQIAIMHDDLVERRRWIDEPRFLHALNFAMLLPGPEAHQLAIYVGWLLNGAPGAVAAGVFFLLPAFVLMVALSWVYAVHGDVGWVSAIFQGLAWGVVGIVTAALVRIGKRALHTPAASAIAIAAFVALFAFGVPFPAIVLAAGVFGFVAGDRLTAPSTGAVDVGPVGRPDVRPTWLRTLRVLVVGALVWFGPLALALLVTGTDGVIADEAVFFSLLALVTFGGAYAALAYLNQAAVTRFGWLTSGEMAVGLSLAETTPGPLILVVVFVGFVAAYRDPGSLGPVAAGVVGAIVTAWATFVPSFLWIFLGAPSVERLRGNVRLGAALAAVTAAVVGVIANLAVVFAIGVLFDERSVERFAGNDVVLPVITSADLLAIAVAAAAFVALRVWRVNVVWVVLGSGLVGVARYLIV
jgi:chromate transporter